jgi:hypothetical protein
VRLDALAQHQIWTFCTTCDFDLLLCAVTQPNFASKGTDLSATILTQTAGPSAAAATLRRFIT